MNKFHILIILLLGFKLSAQNIIDINPTFRHSVGGIDTLDRSVFINIHADNTENEWNNGNNFGNFGNLRDSFLNKYDVYIGRNTGGLTWQLSQMNEDPNRPGFADPNHIAQRGQNVRNNYSGNTNIHQYESRNDLIIAAQHHPFFPDGTPTGQGWTLANGTATGEYMGRYITEFHGGNGQPLPKWVEVMNEPLWEFVTNGDYTPAEVFEFHNEVADAIRAQTTEVPIGGYCTAFPLFERDNFGRWNDRWKSFIDIAGDNMDYYTIHLYDFNSISGGQKKLRKGSNNEATFDMIDHYSHLTLGATKPYVLSEIGGRGHDFEPDPWSPFRDWITMKSFTPMMLQFMDRPHQIQKVIPFIIVKALWGTQPNGNPYPWRLMRIANELPGQTGTHWVYTEMVKFYQLWSDVRGTRIDTRSTNPDVMTQAYVDGNKLYLVMANLNFESTSVDLNLADIMGNSVQNIRVKHLYLDGDAPVLTESNHTDLPNFEIEPEGAAVIEYTFESDINIDQTSNETKYYASEHLTPIIAFGENKFHITGVQKPQYGEAKLRIGFGRDHGKSLLPKVKVNGQEIHVDDNYMGDDQSQRLRWFGLREIRIPWAHLQEDNEISVSFDDAGGHISSMTMRVFEFSEPITRSEDDAVQGINLTPDFKQLEVGNVFKFTAQISPLSATNHQVFWSSDDENIATVDEFGVITAEGIGTTTITATTEDGNLTATATVEVVDEITAVPVTGINLTPETYELEPEQKLQMLAEVLPADVTNKNVSWQSTNETVATVDGNGIVTALQFGETEIIATTEDGNHSDTSHINVFVDLENELFCNLLPDEFDSQVEFDFQVEYTSNEPYDIAVEVKDANNIWRGEGQVTIQPGTGTVTVPVTFRELGTWTPTAPPPGDGYTIYSWIRAVGGNWMTNNGGCTNGNVTVLGVDNTSTPAELQNLSIYPNPTDGVWFLEIPDLKKEATVVVFDVFGENLLQQNITDNHSQLELRNMPSGVYWVKVETKEGSMTKRLVVE